MKNLSAYPLVNVLIPVFNGEKYIARCIASVLSQTYPNIKIKISDNKSEDSTMAKLSTFLSSNITLHQNDSNKGLFENLNQCLEMIDQDSKYFLILCVDDWIAPNYISTLVALMERNEKVQLISSESRYGDGKQYSPIANYISPGVVRLNDSFKKLFFLNTFLFGVNLFSYPVGVFLRCNLIRNEQRFDPKIGSPADVDFFLRVAYQKLIMFTPYCGANVQKHPDQLSTMFKKTKQMFLFSRLLIEQHKLSIGWVAGVVIFLSHSLLPSRLSIKKLGALLIRVPFIFLKLGPFRRVLRPLNAFMLCQLSKRG